MEYSFLWIFVVLGLMRLFELEISRRHLRKLEAIGGREFHHDNFLRVAAFHALFLGALLVESHPWMIPLDALTVFCLVSLAVLSALRYWCVYALGDYWNVRIVVVPGGSVLRTGPYRYLRHPNYLAIALEILILPVLLRAPVTLVIFIVPGLWILRERIRLEEKALRENTDYERAFPPR